MTTRLFLLLPSLLTNDTNNCDNGQVLSYSRRELGTVDILSYLFFMITSWGGILFGVSPIFICLGHHNKIPQTGWLKKQKCISHGSEAWKSKVRVSAGLVSPAAPLLGLHMTAFLLCSCSLCVFIPGASLFKFPLLLQSDLFWQRSDWSRAHPNSLSLTQSPL